MGHFIDLMEAMHLDLIHHDLGYFFIGSTVFDGCTTVVIGL